jgi:D-alanyl-D-alanine carboxypeptidase
MLLLAACSQGYGPGGRVEIGADGWRKPTHYYPPPGPPEDPWGPYVREASARFQVPGHWVRAVMHQESGGEQQATSPVGAMGLMQVMPATYEGLRERYQLGDDPYDPHNSILAGTAYIREMYDRFGSPGFLAAYNAGPERVQNYLAGRASLPDETINYVAAITPSLGTDVPRSGPFAVYASARAGRAQRPTVASLAAGCDLNAAYNPSHPCTSLERAAREPAPIQTAFAPQLGTNGCDLNAAYDPNRPCNALPQTAVASRPTQAPPAEVPAQQMAAASRQAPTPPPAQQVAAASPKPALSQFLIASAMAAEPLPAEKPAPPLQRPSRSPAQGLPAPHPPASSGGDWAIQVGAFASQALARTVAEGARAQAPDQLHSAVLALQPTAPFGGKVLYRARLAHLSASAATNACTRLNQRQLPCLVVRPAGA